MEGKWEDIKTKIALGQCLEVALAPPLPGSERPSSQADIVCYVKSDFFSSFFFFSYLNQNAI